MPKTAKNLLSELAVKGAKPKDKAYKLRDGAGLFLVIESGGKKWWKLRVIFAKKETPFPLANILRTHSPRPGQSGTRPTARLQTALILLQSARWRRLPIGRGEL